MTTKTCAECGAEFTVDRAHYTRRMCSTECAHASWWRQSKERVAAARMARTNLRHDTVTSEVEFLLGTDSPDSIARRLGYSCADMVSKRLTEWGRTDLATRLHAEPVGHVPSGRIVDGWVIR